MYANKKIAFLGEPKIISYPIKYITAIGGIWKEYYDADIIIMSDSSYRKFKGNYYTPKLEHIRKLLISGKNIEIISESEFCGETPKVRSKNQNKRNKGFSIRENLNNYTVIDLETTGKYITTCEIIEMSAVKIRFGKVADTFTTLVKPKGILPKEVTQLTGITPDMLKNAPIITESIEDYVNFIGNDVILGHNITSFDSNLIYDAYFTYSGLEFNNDMLDTYHYARCCNIDVPDYKLVTLAEYFNIENNNAHRALNDCLVNFEVYEDLKPFYNGCYKCSSTLSNKEKFEIYNDLDLSQFVGKQICLSGEFELCTKSEFTSKLLSIGGIVKNSVTSKTDFLIVGSKGSERYNFGNYGTKVKKALELQEKGKHIKIIKEEDMLTWMKLKI